MVITREPLNIEGKGFWGAIKCRVIESLSTIGMSVMLMIEALAYIPIMLFRRDARRDFVGQLYSVGIKTLPVVTVVGLFSGMILGLQVGLALVKFNQESFLGAAVMLSLIREMGPFTTGICLSACVGSAMAAELGTMVVNDEIAAMELMSVPPVRYLVTPRLGALLIMSPLVAFYACVLGVIGGGLVGWTQLAVPFRQYMVSALSIAVPKDLFVGLFKAMVFGIVIGTVSCREGFATRHDATGVGLATQRSVIISFLLILMLGYMITRAFYLEF
jgi:phospholipid/cholesterol/gamma-HCH transport system permease protein